MKFAPVRYLLGLPSVILTWAAASLLTTVPLENHFKRQVDRDSAISALHRNGARTVVAGRDVTIVSDFEPRADQRRAAELAVLALPALRHFGLQVATPVVMTPFRFAVTREPTRLTFSGGVPAGSLHAKLSDDGVAMAGRASLRDELRPAVGAPAGFEEAAAILVAVAGALSTGEVALTDQLVSVHGSAPDFTRYNDVMAALATLPVGFTLGPMDITPPEARPFAWSASRSGETVTLGGYVSSEQARAALRQAAEFELPGLFVRDEMQTARGLGRGIDFTAMSKLAFSALAQLEQGRVELDGSRVSVEGGGPALDLLSALGAEIGRHPPAGTEIGAIDLKPVKLVPYRFAVTRDRSGVALTGYVPDDVYRAAVLTLARQGAADQPVRDDLHLAEGSPEGFAAATRLAVESVSDLAEGRATVTGARVSLSGRTLYPGVAARLRDRLPGALPPGWSGEAVITAEPLAKPLDVTQCSDLLSDVVARDPVRFDPARAEPTAKSRSALDAIGSVLRRCGSARIRVVAEVAPGRDAAVSRVLAQARAEGVAAALAGDAQTGLRITGEGRVGEPEVRSGPPTNAPPPATPAIEDRLTIKVEP